MKHLDKDNREIQVGDFCRINRGISGIITAIAWRKEGIAMCFLHRRYEQVVEYKSLAREFRARIDPQSVQPKLRELLMSEAVKRSAVGGQT